MYSFKNHHFHRYINMIKDKSLFHLDLIHFAIRENQLHSGKCAFGVLFASKVSQLYLGRCSYLWWLFRYKRKSTVLGKMFSPLASISLLKEINCTLKDVLTFSVLFAAFLIHDDFRRHLPSTWFDAETRAKTLWRCDAAPRLCGAMTLWRCGVAPSLAAVV